MLDKTTVAAVARELGRSWDTVNDIAVAATSEPLLTAGPARLDGVERDQSFRDGVEIAAMDGFGGYKNAATDAPLAARRAT